MNVTWIVIPGLLVLAVIAYASNGSLGPQPDVALDRAMRARTIDTLVTELNERYVFPEKAKDVGIFLRQRQRDGTYDRFNNGHALARQLTTDVRSVAKDLHMKVWYAPGVGLLGGADAPESLAQWERQNHFLLRPFLRHMAVRNKVRVGRIGANIGYLRVAGFPDAFLLTDKFAEAMNELADTDGLILDLRRNSGGDPQAVVLLISYFVDRRSRLNDVWDRATGITTPHWTHEKLDGKRYGSKKPVLILAGPETASAGEDFAYTMQALGRATVVGEPTWGGAHPISMYRLSGDFYASIPVSRTISPITGSNWEGVGVTPDIVATPENALPVATQLMRRRLNAAATLVATGH